MIEKKLVGDGVGNPVVMECVSIRSRADVEPCCEGGAEGRSSSGMVINGSYSLYAW